MLERDDNRKTEIKTATPVELPATKRCKYYGSSHKWDDARDMWKVLQDEPFQKCVQEFQEKCSP